MELINFSNEEKQRLDEWHELRSRALRGDRSAQKALDQIPTIAGRPAWASLKEGGLVLKSELTDKVKEEKIEGLGNLVRQIPPKFSPPVA